MTDQIPPVPAPDGTPATPVAPAAAPAAAPYAAPAAAAPAAGTWNVLAIVSLVIAIVGFSWLSLGAVITGHIALSQFKTNPQQQGRGLALAGTIVGYVGILATVIWVVALIAIGLAAASAGYSSY